MLRQCVAISLTIQAVARRLRSTLSNTAMILRPDHDAPPEARQQACPAGGGRPRLNLLLSRGGWRRDAALDQLPALLAPLGIHSVTASSGEEAAEVIRSVSVHIAVVDLAIPLQRTQTAVGAPPVGSGEGGPRILQLLRRLDQPPPTVVVRPPQPAARESARGLMQALREGAFAVLDQPVHLESMLEVLRRILRRHYSDCWPAS
jgi:CheY-like chemotaxis protein